MEISQLNYARFVASILKEMPTEKDNLAHCAMGISGEAGELLDAIKKNWAYNKPLDMENVIEELGDMEFYMEALRIQLNITRQETIDANVKKLSRRYHEGKYSDTQAVNRADKTEAGDEK